MLQLLCVLFLNLAKRFFYAQISYHLTDIRDKFGRLLLIEQLFSVLFDGPKANLFLNNRFNRGVGNLKQHYIRVGNLLLFV